MAQHATLEQDNLPEQTFFQDPAIDRVLAFAFTLATEVWVLRDRLAAMESLLVEKGVLPAGALDGFRPAGNGEAVAADRNEFVHHLMNNLMGRQASKGAPDDLLARFGDGPKH